MQLSSSLRQRFLNGRFEEFLDRAEDHLTYGLAAKLGHRRMNMSRANYRDLARSSYEAAKKLGRPGEALTIRIAEGRLLFGLGFLSDPRFAAATDILRDAAISPAERDAAFAGIIERTQPLWGRDQRKTHMSTIIATQDTRDTADRLRQLSGVFQPDYAQLCSDQQFDQFTQDVARRAQNAELPDTNAEFKFIALTLSYGPRFFNDPFQSDFNFDPSDTIAKTRMLARALNMD